MENLKLGNISLVLDNYDYIFSDFDPRPYETRALSDDFLEECKRAALDKDEGGFELRLMIPRSRRKHSAETEVIKRLKHHFHKHFHEFLTADRQLKQTSFWWFALGVALIFLAVLVSDWNTWWGKLLLVTLEPAGWFTAWTALERLFIDSKSHRANLSFYRKMSGAEIIFFDY